MFLPLDTTVSLTSPVHFRPFCATTLTHLSFVYSAVYYSKSLSYRLSSHWLDCWARFVHCREKTHSDVAKAFVGMKNALIYLQVLVITFE